MDGGVACCAEIDLECFGCNMALYDDGIVSFLLSQREFNISSINANLAM